MRCHSPSSKALLTRAGIALAALALALLPCAAQQVRIHRNSFETMNPFWVKGAADVAYTVAAHVITDQGSHDLQRCEYLRLDARQGSHIHYQYATHPAPLSDELTVGLWLKANRPGVQILARVVLPNERDPNSLDDRLTTLVRGDVYRGPAMRWKRLELGRIVALAKQQQQMMQEQLGRPVNFKDAYVDAVVLNVYGGPGTTEVWIDALEVGPVIEPAPGAAPPGPAPGAAPDGPRRSGAPGAVVEYNGSHLLVGGKRFFFRGVRHTGAPVRALRELGFNTLFCDHDADPRTLRDAVDMGLRLVPHLPVASDDARLVSADGIGRQIRTFPEPDAVLFWELGNSLSYEQSNLVARSAQHVRTADPTRPIGGDAWDGLGRYSGSLNLLGVHRWPLMTGMELTQYRDWLEQRGRLANPGTFLWTWVQTHLPEWFVNVLYHRGSGNGFTEPVGPQPEHLRLMTYIAVGSGARGLGFWSDQYLADSHQGRDRRLCVALLNQELEMLEPLLLEVVSAPKWINTSVEEVKAAVLRGPRGVLVLPVWMGGASQYVPGQAAAAKLTVTVPQVPKSAQVWEVSPGEVRSHRFDRVAEGLRVTLPEFGLTTALVFTTDQSLVVRLQEQARARRQLAAQYTYDMAVQELEKVTRVHEQLASRNMSVADARQLLDDARARLETARGHWDNGLMTEAYKESQRALRPLRILMRAEWDKARRGLDRVVSSPYAVSYYTLPRHLDFMAQVTAATAAANALPDGGFEHDPARQQQPWAPQSAALDDVELTAERVRDLTATSKARAQSPDADPLLGNPAPPAAVPPARAPTAELDAPPQRTGNDLPKEGSYCLKLEIRPKDRAHPPLALERTFLAVNSPSVRLPPGTLVRVSAWVNVPRPITASVDGALLYDSAGGEPLALRLGQTKGWERYTLYRRVPSSGLINVTLALTGLGTAYFDDVKIEPLVAAPPPSTPSPYSGR